MTLHPTLYNYLRDSGRSAEEIENCVKSKENIWISLVDVNDLLTNGKAKGKAIRDIESPPCQSEQPTKCWLCGWPCEHGECDMCYNEMNED